VDQKSRPGGGRVAGGNSSTCTKPRTKGVGGQNAERSGTKSALQLDLKWIKELYREVFVGMGWTASSAGASSFKDQGLLRSGDRQR